MYVDETVWPSGWPTDEPLTCVGGMIALLTRPNEREDQAGTAKDSAGFTETTSALEVLKGDLAGVTELEP